MENEIPEFEICRACGVRFPLGAEAMERPERAQGVACRKRCLKCYDNYESDLAKAYFARGGSKPRSHSDCPTDRFNRVAAASNTRAKKYKAKGILTGAQVRQQWKDQERGMGLRGMQFEKIGKATERFCS